MSIYIPTPEELEAKYEPHTILLLRQLKIPDNLRGFTYLSSAIPHAAANPSQILYVTKELYPYVARKFTSTDSRVERDIRNAIQIGWRLGMQEPLEQIAGTSVPQRPTNSFLILLLANYIRLH